MTTSLAAPTTSRAGCPGVAVSSAGEFLAALVAVFISNGDQPGRTAAY